MTDPASNAVSACLRHPQPHRSHQACRQVRATYARPRLQHNSRLNDRLTCMPPLASRVGRRALTTPSCASYRTPFAALSDPARPVPLPVALADAPWRRHAWLQSRRASCSRMWQHEGWVRGHRPERVRADEVHPDEVHGREAHAGEAHAGEAHLAYISTARATSMRMRPQTTARTP
jgi:hypothetical protein